MINLRSTIVAAAVAAAGVAQVHAQGTALQQQNLLLVYNSQNAESLAIRNAYVAVYPNVVQLNLDNAAIAAPDPTNGWQIDRPTYLSAVRQPILDFINGTSTGNDLSQQICAIVTTRGMPARIAGTGEFSLGCTIASVESELTLLQQDLESTAGTTSGLPNRYSGIVQNPYLASFSNIRQFSRSAVKTQRTFSAQGAAPNQAWQITGLTPGGIYLVMRLDAAPGAATTAVQEVQKLIGRSRRIVLSRCQVQSLFDRFRVECGALDDDSFPPLFVNSSDFQLCNNNLSAAGWATTFDQTIDFVVQQFMPQPTRPILFYGTYGVNHAIFVDPNVCGFSPSGGTAYIQNFTFHPAAVCVAYESFSGESIVTGGNRGQGQALDFITRGGSFTFGSVAEPFTFSIPRMEFLRINFLNSGRTWVEAAYSAMPGLSWQITPLGNPLARIVVASNPLDADGNGTVNIEDVYAWHDVPIDANCDFLINDADRQAVQAAARANETSGMLVGR
ncbi:MAG: hypothetical protein IBJ11_04210 [Phycisphaerales bacterium]|nr:hypothetical protein [Phycisphaerales bacterium]